MNSETPSLATDRPMNPEGSIDDADTEGPGDAPAYLPSNPGDVVATLTTRLQSLVRDSFEQEVETATLAHALALTSHLHTLAWRSVARGDLKAPGRVLAQLSPLQKFMEAKSPDLPPVERAAVELRSCVTAFFIAHESLASVRAEARIKRNQATSLERSILRVLLKNTESYLRRGQIHSRLNMNKKPSAVRVGQVLTGLTEEGLLQRIHAAARGNSTTAHYALSPLGHEVCGQLQISRDSGESSPETHAFAEAIDVVCCPKTSADMRRLYLALALQAFRVKPRGCMSIVERKLEYYRTQGLDEQARNIRKLLDHLVATHVARDIGNTTKIGGLNVRTFEAIGEGSRVPPEYREPPSREADDPNHISSTVPNLSDEKMLELFGDLDIETIMKNTPRNQPGKALR